MYICYLKQNNHDRSNSDEDIEQAFKVGFSIGYISHVHAVDAFNHWFKQFNKK